MRPSRRPVRQRGAALLILLSVVGLGVATLLISALGGNPQAARERRTLITLSQASDALVGFAVSNGRLPRPAISAVDGRENPTPCGSEQDCTGILPWVTLGVDGSDSWGKRLGYSVTPVMTNAPVPSINAVATKTVRWRRAGGALSYAGGQAQCGVETPCLPFVVFSSGKNNFGTSEAGVPQANTSRSNADEARNAAAARDFITRVASANPAQPGGEFDDLVLWIPLAPLYKRMRAAHNLP